MMFILNNSSIWYVLIKIKLHRNSSLVQLVIWSLAITTMDSSSTYLTHALLSAWLWLCSTRSRQSVPYFLGTYTDYLKISHKNPAVVVCISVWFVCIYTSLSICIIGPYIKYANGGLGYLSIFNRFLKSLKTANSKMQW